MFFLKKKTTQEIIEPQLRQRRWWLRDINPSVQQIGLQEGLAVGVGRWIMEAPGLGTLGAWQKDRGHILCHLPPPLATMIGPGVNTLQILVQI